MPTEEKIHIVKEDTKATYCGRQLFDLDGKVNLGLIITVQGEDARLLAIGGSSSACFDCVMPYLKALDAELKRERLKEVVRRAEDTIRQYKAELRAKIHIILKNAGIKRLKYVSRIRYGGRMRLRSEIRVRTRSRIKRLGTRKRLGQK